ncbi:hypothetical protein QAD02_001876 [Eretmocerus hayati]|uniref:Uncharacterized protein n=1 Tax=Eretmocerus hayati TaxID=131215 RepID=A0ACC2NK57_9HYME|nr:hypothetical protein QAD02_001876 [Eretmocerus hayati]
MPQEAWVVKCYSCTKFQVQLEKKAKKWKCVVCGAKQDLMKIFFKGSPKDCRLNVQNMNMAEGELLEKVTEQSQYQLYHHNNWENISQNSQEYSSCENNDAMRITQDLGEDAMADIDDQCFESVACSQELDQVRRINEELSMKSVVQSEIEGSPVSPSKDVFDVNSIDFSIKTVPSNASSINRGAQALKLSIFESNAEFDESLDF